jgi:hypothetical protein
MMKQFIVKAFAGAGILLCGLTANAQPQSRYDYRYRYNDDQTRLLWRVQANLDRAAANTIDSGDRYRIISAKQEVMDVRNDLANGRMDNRELQQAIRSVRQVLNTATLTPRDRDILENDLVRMRELRVSSFRDWR